MNLKEFLYKTVKTTINGMISEGKPIPMDTPNDFVYPDFKKYAYKNRKMFKKELQKSNGDSSKMFLTLSALWYKWARKNHPNFTHIKDSKKFGRALMVMMVKDDLIFSIDAFKKTNNIAKLKEDSELDQAFLKAKPVEEETKRDYKKEYAKYGKSKKAKKYRAELNKYNRDKGTYGNGDGKDASHKGGKIVGFEDESKNRGRREKSRLKKEATFVPNSGTMSGGVLQLDNRKYQLKKDIKNVKIGSYIVTLPKGTILYNIAGGLFADHKSLEQYADRNRQYFKKPTFKGIQITQKTDTIKDIDKNSKVLENVAPNHNGKSAPFGSGYDELKEACWDNYKQVGMKTKGGKQVPNCVPESIVKEGVMSDINLLINKSKSEEEFIKTFFKKYGKQVKKSKESIEWVTDLYMDTKNESINEAKYYITRNLGRGQGKALIRQYDIKKQKTSDKPKEFKSYKDAQKEVEKLQRGGSMGGQMTAYIITDKDMNMLKPNGKKMFESVNEASSKYPNFDLDKNIRYQDTVITNGMWRYTGKEQGGKGVYRNLNNNQFLGFHRDDFKYFKKHLKKHFDIDESITEEQIDEKLITFSNRAPYGQIVFMAGGAGSGKGFAKDNFIDSAGFKVRDVDEMKKAVGKLDQLGKFSVDKWYKKYGKKLSDKPKGGGLSPKAHVEEFVLGKGMSISDISKDLKNPNNVASLHYIVDSMGLKDKWLISMLSGKDNKETLPNLLFDITSKKVSAITDVIKPLIANGYDAKNVHLIWVLANFHVAIKANKERDRMVPEDILLQTHEGAGKTMWEIMTKILPKGLNGRIDVILNKRAETVPYVDSNGKPIMVQPNQKNKLKDAQIVVKGFTSLPIKKQGGGVQPEKAWKEILKKWVLDNAPKTIDLSQQIEEGNNDYFKTAGEAVEFAKKAAEKKGFDIDEDDWNSQITMGGKYNRLRPGVGKTHSFQIGLLKKGKPQRKGLAISLYGMNSGKYELTHYIN
jgi:predicted DNA-binding WGR domain protein